MFDHWLWFVCESLVKIVTVVVCPRGGVVLWFSVVPRGSRYVYPSWVELCCGTCVSSLAGDEELADVSVVYAGVVQTCTTSSRVVESFELVLPRGIYRFYHDSVDTPIDGVDTGS
ncbi:hypothetical protein Taro_040591 [Colocasia esculenta]|uniref:Uncharacterized protein n=1 Tax=Colocasia esculenta TaxID=4460 RepID=A0A843WDL5_COLES|nr:hypothetical protein [Colocasia esculenta]